MPELPVHSLESPTAFSHSPELTHAGRVTAAVAHWAHLSGPAMPLEILFHRHMSRLRANPQLLRD